MKKLFAIKEASTGRVLDGKDYDKKAEAKNERKRLNEIEEGKEEIFRYVVTLGVEHDDYMSNEERKEKVARQPIRISRKKKVELEETV